MDFGRWQESKKKRNHQLTLIKKDTPRIALINPDENNVGLEKSALSLVLSQKGFVKTPSGVTYYSLQWSLRNCRKGTKTTEPRRGDRKGGEAF